MKIMYVNILVMVLIISGCAKNRAAEGAKTEPVNPVNIEEKIEKELREYGELEPKTSIFPDLKGAGSFIEKFRLSAEEIEIVGKWNPWTIGERVNAFGQPINEYGTGIKISFLPNRIFIATSQESPRDADGNFLDGSYFYKLGYWKVEKSELSIQFKYLYERKDTDKAGVYNQKQKIETDYFPIWRPNLYDMAAVQKDTFYYNKIPKKVRAAYHINNKDFLRSRRVIGLAFDGKNLSLYGEGKLWHKFLISPDIDDEQYAHNLLIMYILVGDVNGRPYDFDKNKYGLDFSRWQ
jgi:hypothetical protein